MLLKCVYQALQQQTQVNKPMSQQILQSRNILEDRTHILISSRCSMTFFTSHFDIHFKVIGCHIEFSFINDNYSNLTHSNIFFQIYSLMHLNKINDNLDLLVNVTDGDNGFITHSKYL